jgi:hypothetical protein
MFGLDPFFIVFGIVAVLFLVLFVALAVNGAVLARRRNHVLRAAGLDPALTGAEQLAVSRVRDQQAGTVRGVEERLAEVDDLLRREVISAQEHATARA